MQRTEKKDFPSAIKILLALLIVSLLSAFLLLYKPATIWYYSEMPISNLQSVFQLGIATSIAFALGRPYFRHALGPDLQRTIRYIYTRSKHYSLPQMEFFKLIFHIREYRRYEEGLVALSQPYFFILYSLSALANTLLLLWSSAINSTGSTLSRNALTLCMVATALFVLGVWDAYVGARRMQLLLRKARSACDSGKSEYIAAICEEIKGKMKEIRLGDYPF